MRPKAPLHNRVREYRPGDGARLALGMAEDSLVVEQRRAEDLQAEMLRCRARIMALDTDSPTSEYDGNGWAAYWRAKA